MLRKRDLTPTAAEVAALQVPILPSPYPLDERNCPAGTQYHGAYCRQGNSRRSRRGHVLCRIGDTLQTSRYDIPAERRTFYCPVGYSCKIYEEPSAAPQGLDAPTPAAGPAYALTPSGNGHADVHAISVSRVAGVSIAIGLQQPTGRRANARPPRRAAIWTWRSPLPVPKVDCVPWESMPKQDSRGRKPRRRGDRDRDRDGDRDGDRENGGGSAAKRQAAHRRTDAYQNEHDAKQGTNSNICPLTVRFGDRILGIVTRAT